MVVTTRCTRSITPAKSTRALASAMPSSVARAMSDSRRADRMSALLGTQPVFRQSPPILCASTMATRALVAAAM